MFRSKLTSIFIENIDSAKLTSKILKRSMSNEILKQIFFKSVQSVQPERLIRNHVKLRGHHLAVKDFTYALRKPCYIVGCGKAVLGMATELEDVLGDSLERGVVTVPVGIFENYPRKHQSRTEFIEGAKDNLPDKEAEKGAGMIKRLVEGLTEEDLLIVLISGKYPSNESIAINYDKIRVENNSGWDFLSSNLAS